jgi:hypothetical protein
MPLRSMCFNAQRVIERGGENFSCFFKENKFLLFLKSQEKIKK